MTHGRPWEGLLEHAALDCTTGLAGGMSMRGSALPSLLTCPHDVVVQQRLRLLPPISKPHPKAPHKRHPLVVVVHQRLCLLPPKALEPPAGQPSGV